MSHLLGLNVDDTPTTNVSGFALGTRCEDHRGYEYIYVHANGAIAQYDFVVFDEAFEAYSITAALAIDHPSGGAAQVAFADQVLSNHRTTRNMDQPTNHTNRLYIQALSQEYTNPE